MKQIDVEKLVRWAYREELPKAAPVSPVMPSGFGFAWGGVAGYGALLANVDEPDIRNRYGVVPDLTAQVQPHPDAIRVWTAVQNLDEMSITLPADWSPLDDMGDLGAHGPAATDRALGRLFLPSTTRTETAILVGFHSARIEHTVETVDLRLRKPMSELIQTAAILGPPDWQSDKPVLRCMTNANGTVRWFRRTTIVGEHGPIEVETDGYDTHRRRPHVDAYPKEYLDPDPAGCAVRRGQYQLWLAGLAAVVDDLAGRLDEFEPLPSSHSSEPWTEDEDTPPRVLEDRSPAKPLERTSRPLAGPPPHRGQPRKKPEREKYRRPRIAAE
jgi:hypothetical protein